VSWAVEIGKRTGCKIAVRRLIQRGHIAPSTGFLACEHTGRAGVPGFDDHLLTVWVSLIPPPASDFTRKFADDTTGQIDFTTFEQLVIDLIGDFEQKGLSQGSRNPAIFSAIFAIYREFA
jgi:hypothetical protein